VDNTGDGSVDVATLLTNALALLRSQAACCNPGKEGLFGFPSAVQRLTVREIRLALA